MNSRFEESKIVVVLKKSEVINMWLMHNKMVLAMDSKECNVSVIIHQVNNCDK